MTTETKHDRRRDAVLEIAAAYEAAFNSNDARAMNSLFTDDATFVNFGGELVFGKEPLHQAQAAVFDRGGVLEHIHVRYLTEAVAFPDHDSALVHLRQRSARADRTLVDAMPDPMEGILTLVLVLTASGDWRIRAGQNTPVTTTSSRDGVRR